MNIYIIRHGQTNANLKGAYYGRLDIPLNAKGIKQMKRLRPALENIVFDRVYSSDCSRTLESLKLCGNDLYQQVQIDPRLAEIDFGVFEGMTYKEIANTYPKLTSEWQANWKGFCPPDGESFTDFYHRVVLFWEEILTSPRDNILIMAHSGTIKAIYCYILGSNLDLFWNFTAHNGKINLIKYEYGNVFIDGMNMGGVL